MIIGIYKIKNIINNKVYIGQSKNIHFRWYHHKNLLNKNKHFNFHLQNAWNKFGEQNFQFEIIQECNLEMLNHYETFWINENKSFIKKYGYNNKNIINGKIVFSDEIKNKMSLNHADFKKEKHPLWNKKQSKSACEKMSQTKKEMYSNGILVSPMKDKKHTNEAKQKMRNAKIGKPPPNKGIKGIIKHTENWKNNMSIIMSGENHPNCKLNWKIINQIRNDYNNKIGSMRFLAKKYNISQSSINNIINNISWKSNNSGSSTEPSNGEELKL